MIKFLILALFIFAVTSFDLMGSNVKNSKFFEVILDRYEIIKESSDIIGLHVQIKKINKTRVIVGYLTYHEPIGNNFNIGIQLLKKQGGEYRYMPYSVPPGPFCDVLSKDNYLYPEIAKQSDLPEDVANNCPFPAGNYSFYGAKSNLDNAPTIMLQTGEYAGEITYQLNGQDIAIYRLFVYINHV